MREKISTKEKILEIACKLFANNGYQGTTISDICSQAEVNIASVNYHFGNKDNLFKEAWLYAYDELEKKYTLKLNPNDEPVEALKLFLNKFIRKMTDKDAYAVDILEKDHISSNGLLHEVAYAKLIPSKELLKTLIYKINPNLPLVKLEFLQSTLMSQIFHLRKIDNSCKNSKINVDLEQWIEDILDLMILGIKNLNEKK